MIVKFLAFVFCFSFALYAVLAVAEVKKFDVTISWAPVVNDIAGRPIIGLKGYRVYVYKRSINACATPYPSPTPFEMIVEAKTNQTTLQLEPGTYYVSVAAITDRLGLRSDEVQVIVPTTAPDKPRIIQLNFKVP